MKKVLIITSSLRQQSNSNILADKFKEGAIDNGNKVEVISLLNNKVAPCTGCGSCQVHGKCIMKDKLNDILDKVIECDVLVFVSPIYYYSINGTLKNFIDRTYAKFNRIKDKDFYFIGSCADNSHASIDGALQTINGFLRCIDNVKLKGVIYGTELMDAGEANYSNHIEEAYKLGKNI